MFSQRNLSSTQPLGNATTSDPKLALQHLQRISQKPGVHSTLILSRATGAIVHYTGLPSLDDPKKTAPSAQGESNGIAGTEAHLRSRRGGGVQASASANGDGDEKHDVKTVEDIADMVLKLFAAAGQFAQGVGEKRGKEEDEEDGEDGGEEEVRLMRLRLRRREVVVVPDAKYLLVVIHDPQSRQT